MKLFTRTGVLTGITATLTMDCLTAIAHRLGVTTPLRPHLIGRWFASVVRLQPFHSDIAQSPAAGNEMAIALVGHYVIGLTLACLYLWLTTRLRWPRRQLRCALGYAACTNALPWLIMFPAMGYGFFGAHAPPGARLFLSSLCSHAFFGLGLWIAMSALTAKTFDGRGQPAFKGAAAR